MELSSHECDLTVVYIPEGGEQTFHVQDGGDVDHELRMRTTTFSA